MYYVLILVQIHGILNGISWGILFPIGVIIARYLRTFNSADPAWFYLHVACQISAYAIGVAGWATGLQLGSESKGIVYTGHRCVGIVLFSLATLQVGLSAYLRSYVFNLHVKCASNGNRECLAVTF